jgi:hypothetical protein
MARSCARVLDNLFQVSVKWVNMKGNKVARELARHAILEPKKKFRDITNRYWFSDDWR